MIQPIDVDDNFGLDSQEYCRIHDMVLDLIVSLSDEENFATVLNERVCNSLPSKIRRISMQSSDEKHKWAIRAITGTKLHVRSLNVFGAIEQIPPLADFHALRVLDLQRCKWLEDKHVKNIGSLCQLRYLCLGGDITELPGEIGKLQYLETLDLWRCYSIQRLPSTTVQLLKLQRLFLSWHTTLSADKFGSMQTLEELIVCQTDNIGRFAEELGHLTNLRKLTINKVPYLGDDRERVLELLSSSLSALGKCNLRYLRAYGDICECLFRDPSCTTYPHLQVLVILLFVGRVPNGMASLKNVVNLDMVVGALDEEGLHLLMGMPSLEHLHLGIIDDDVKERLVIGRNGFKRLKVFYFSHLNVCRGFLVTPGAMPALQRLYLCLYTSGYCGDVDLGIEHLSALAHLEVQIDCDGATRGDVEAAEALVKKQSAGIPSATLLMPMSVEQMRTTCLRKRKARTPTVATDQLPSSAWKPSDVESYKSDQPCHLLQDYNWPSE